eukprot:GFUD01034810.1.p1 GENE.GFUD01034810.1~~GFUD01034810.1.p1  ORF type:complete len:905 (+),score=215.05 GFUD01034810.1:108-2822(+)
MSGAIEDIAKKWMSEPAYTKVFKHTADVIEDYICYFLTAVGAIALSVRFLTSLGTGDLSCIVTGVKSTNDTDKDLGPYPSGATLSMVNYANFNQECVDSAMTPFMQYLPFILLLEAVSIILIEKMLMKFPRVAGKIERFYGSIVEEALFGKDPDVAEDVMDDKANAEAISRRRRRNEICMSLKRSSVIHNTYIIKNIAEILLLCFFIPFNIIFAVDAEQNLDPSTCIINILEFPNLGIHEEGQIYFYCQGKKVHFFLRLLYIQTGTLVLVLFCSLGSLIWCFFFRSVSKLLDKIETYKIDWDVEIEKNDGQDFLFLFDLLAHTSGIESTLRVLTHADETFKKICLPKLKNDAEHIRVEEEKIKVVWKPASLENWLEENSHKGIVVDSYDVTIFPAESVNNSVTRLKEEIDKDGNYVAWFFDLQGGKTEYVVTIACVIGKSRMKGERIVTTLLPYGPEKPRAGVVKTFTTDEVEIAWEPPKGGFTKYVLCVDPNVVSTLSPRIAGMGRSLYMNGNIGSVTSFGKISKDYHERELSNLLTDHKISGLSPGEIYGIELKTKTGGRFTRQPIYETVMTKPQQVESFTVGDIATTTATVKWVAPEGHKRLRAFNLSISSIDNKIKRELAVKHNSEKTVNSFQFDNILQGTEYSVTINSVCVFETLKTTSDEKLLTFCTLPEAPSNLVLESRFPNSLTVKWDSPSVTQATHRYKLSIEALAIAYSTDYTIPGDKHTFIFSKLPEIVGTGETYTVKVEYVVTPAGSDQEVTSTALIGTFTTKPLAPTNFKLGMEPNEITWMKSPSPNVSAYKIRCKGVEEGAKAEEFFIPSPEDPETTSCKWELEDIYSDVLYKINIYAVVNDSNKEQIESKELHEKVILQSGRLTVYTEETDRQSEMSGGHFSRQVSTAQ